MSLEFESVQKEKMKVVADNLNQAMKRVRDIEEQMRILESELNLALCDLECVLEGHDENLLRWFEKLNVQ